jgi:hypothetical protein
MFCDHRPRVVRAFHWPGGGASEWLARAPFAPMLKAVFAAQRRLAWATDAREAR